MVNVIFEITKKELSSYFSQKTAIFRNVVFLVLFAGLTLFNLAKSVDQHSPSAAFISAALDVLLALAAIFPVNMAGGISVMAFPVERDQKTLEHLLSLPLSDRDIFLGKFLAAVIAGIAGLVLILLIIFGYTAFSYRIAPGDLLSNGSLSLMVFAICPMLVILLILVTVVISPHISARETYIANVVSVFVLLGLNLAADSLNVDKLVFNGALVAILAVAILIMYVIGTRTFSREKLIVNL